MHKISCLILVFLKIRKTSFAKKTFLLGVNHFFAFWLHTYIFFSCHFFFYIFYHNKKRLNLSQILDRINYPNLSCHNQLYLKHTQGGRTLKTSGPQYSLIGATLSSGSILAMPRSFLGVLLDNTKWEPLGRPKTSLEF